MNEEQKQESMPNSLDLLKKMSSRITFAVGALLGILVAKLFGEPMSVGILFGGALALTLTTMFAPNKTSKERVLLGGAMAIFVIVAIVAYVIY